MDPKMPQMCPLCARPAQLRDNENTIDTLRVACATCGTFSLPGLLFFAFFEFHNSESPEKALLPYLSAHTRQTWERGEEIFLDNDNWEAFAQSHAKIPVATKLERLLELIASRSKPGLAAKFDNKTDPPLVDAVRAQELSWMLGNLVKDGYAKRVGKWLYALEPKGWKKVQEPSGGAVPEASQNEAPEPARQFSVHYVDPTRIDELSSLKNTRFDLSKLIRTCEELNICFTEECYLAVAMLVRSVLDHVPPIFGCEDFAEVANSSGKSFKDSMLHLENSSRKIADSHLHQQIRKSESLPNKTQVNFTNDIDVLLSEVVRILR